MSENIAIENGGTLTVSGLFVSARVDDTQKITTIERGIADWRKSINNIKFIVEYEES